MTFCIYLTVFRNGSDSQKDVGESATPDVMKTDDVFVPVSVSLSVLAVCSITELHDGFRERLH